MAKTFVVSKEEFEELRSELKTIKEDRRRKAFRGKDVKRMTKPWVSREVVFTCSNGWTIEKIEKEDYWLEALFMGHCLDSHREEAWSLREEDGTSHTTLYLRYNGISAVGRCNNKPPDKYMDLCLEWNQGITPELKGAEIDDDIEYHEEKILNAKDFMNRRGEVLYA